MTPMSHRERVLKALNHEETDRVAERALSRYAPSSPVVELRNTLVSIHYLGPKTCQLPWKASAVNASIETMNRSPSSPKKKDKKRLI